MAESVEERIAERKAIADEHMRHQGYFGRLFNRAGLAAANGVDRATPFSGSGIGSFIVGAVGGAVKGAVLGLVAGAVLATLGILSPAAVAAGAIYSIMGAGALVYGLYHGIKAAQEHRANDDGRRLPDKIAEAAGAVPAQGRAQHRAAYQGYITEQQEINAGRYFRQQERERGELRRREGGDRVL
jgi:hypothetical protein